MTPNDKVSLIQEVFYNEYDETPYEYQIDAILAILDGKDVLVSAATGSGKSRVFQVPAMIDGGRIVLVIVPLKSLMYDQVNSTLPERLLIQVG